MYQLNAGRGGICFKDIQREDLPEILRWYNDIPEFEFATGVDAPISLDKLADSFEDEINGSIEKFTMMAEPISILLVGTIVGIFVIGMFMPIIEMTRVLQQ